MSASDDVAAIAGKLTEVQRSWLIATEPTLERVDKVPCAEWWDNPERLYVEDGGRDLWLATRCLGSAAGTSEWTESWEQLTPLGLAVRDILLENKKAQRCRPSTGRKRTVTTAARSPERT